ncbi:hypothetical protein ABNG03_10950 [Halorubrum sp. RMP-47]|uniref:Uncharacterized protein n=1 Tax=Halorubrum miltondacostae TaxID=3076378 RepID=A0ABD5M848_9EURY
MSEEITTPIEQILNGIDDQSDAIEQVAANVHQLSPMSDSLYHYADLFKIATDENANLTHTK